MLSSGNVNTCFMFVIDFNFYILTFKDLTNCRMGFEHRALNQCSQRYTRSRAKTPGNKHGNMCN